MTRHFQALLGLALALLFALFYVWQNPHTRTTSAEIDHFVARARQLPLPPAEKEQLVMRLRAWLETDDGKPVYMLNLMRMHKELQLYPGATPFQGTPEQSNGAYEAVATGLLLKNGDYPLYAGDVRESNVISFEPELDHWDRVLIVRYKGRRAFAELLTDPKYAQVVSMKLSALKVVLVPTREVLTLPNLTWILGAIGLFIFLSSGWYRAARRVTLQQ